MTTADALFVSVVIPARNEAAQIGATIRAALAAACADEADFRAEVIVVDNASTDGTADRARAAAEAMTPASPASPCRLRVVHCDTPGAARARNAGAAVARGKVLVFVDADTHVPPDALRRVARHVRGGYGAGIFRLDAQAPAGLRAACWWAFWNHVRRLPLARAKALPAFMFCTRAVFDQFGPFDEAVAIGEEWPILAGLYRADRSRLVYDLGPAARTSCRRMALQRFGYTRTYLRYALAVLMPRARVNYTDSVREEAPAGRGGA